MNLLRDLKGKERIVILGPNGSGKSTLGHTLSIRLGLHCYHLDEHYWLPNWQKPEQNLWGSKVKELASSSRWIIEGDYLSTLNCRVKRADQIIWLWPPTFLHMGRFLYRNLTNLGKQRRYMGAGCKERISLSQLVHAATYKRRTKDEKANLVRTGPNTLIIHSFDKDTLDYKLSRKVERLSLGKLL